MAVVDIGAMRVSVRHRWMSVRVDVWFPCRDVDRVRVRVIGVVYVLMRVLGRLVGVRVLVAFGDR